MFVYLYLFADFKSKIIIKKKTKKPKMNTKKKNKEQNKQKENYI
jgi:hypothetical protein